MNDAELRDPISSADYESRDLSVLNQFIRGFYTDAAEHFTKLRNADNIRVIRKHNGIKLLEFILVHGMVHRTLLSQIFSNALPRIHIPLAVQIPAVVFTRFFNELRGILGRCVFRQEA